MILCILLLIAAVLLPQFDARSNDYSDDAESKYRFVVALLNNKDRQHRRHCTGTLISPNWVLTAAVCLADMSHIQFDELQLSFNETNSVRQVLGKEQPPTSMGLGLMFVNAVPMKDYGQLSAVDYKAIAGHAIAYAGFGPVKNKSSHSVGPLLVGEGVVSSCNAEEEQPTLSFAPVPLLCVAPKCSERERRRSAGQPGSPLFHADKLVGVHIGHVKLNHMRSYTPVSPYLTWIYGVVAKSDVMARPGQKYIPKGYEYRKTAIENQIKTKPYLGFSF